MPLPSSGPLSISAIRNEEVNNGGFASSYSLRQLSAWAGFSTPDSISEFYGYSATHNVTITFYYPSYVGCYNTYCFYATSNEALSTNLAVTMYWYGDLGGAFVGTVTINAGAVCGSNCSVNSGGVNCGGENISATNYYFTPGSYGSQNYIGGATYYDLAPC